jgi:ribosomal RNA assembly protein
MTEEIIDLINIPKERVAVLIGEKGGIKKRIQKECDVRLEIDEEGEVSIIRKTTGDILKALKAQDIIRAIARGFSPQKAFKLLDPNIYLELIDLSEYVSDRSMERIRARLIGSEGKARKYISRLTKTDISIYGKTVGIIGDAEGVGAAKESVLRLIEGQPHSAVFRFAELHKR